MNIKLFLQGVRGQPTMFFRNKWTPLFLSNFLGVFNDNFLKNAIIFMAISWSSSFHITQSLLTSLVSGALILPYLFLSPLGGHFAVIYSKKKVFRICKLLEIPVLGVACMAFYFQWTSMAILSVLFMGILSCLYSPAKYSLIHDIGGEEGASFGSGVFEMMAFLGILSGTVVASVVSDHYSHAFAFSLMLGLAVIGFLATNAIQAKELPENKSESTTLNPFLFLVQSFRLAKNYKDVNNAVFGASSFWLIGGMLQMNLVIHTKLFYHQSNSVTGMVMACAAIGIALGTLSAGKISGKGVKKGLILIGITGMVLLFALLAFIHLHFWVYVVCVFSTAFMGGIFQIPCLSIVQNAGLGRQLGAIFAYLNTITFIFVLLGTLLFFLITHFTSENSFAVFASLFFICLLIGVYFFRKSPEFRNETKSMLTKNIR